MRLDMVHSEMLAGDREEPAMRVAEAGSDAVERR